MTRSVILSEVEGSHAVRVSYEISRFARNDNIVIDLEIYKLKRNYKIPEKEVRRVFKKACRLLKTKNLKISLAFVDDKTIKRLNKKYRGKDKVTDVLSFELSPLIFNTDNDVAAGFSLRSSATRSASGEIIISYPEAKRQSREYKESLQKTVSRLFIHGLLHLVGYDHKTIKERQTMEKIQEKLLNC